MPDHRADGAVVHGVVGVRIEERRLQNGRGKHDFVVQRVVVGVDLLRCHLPLGAVDGQVQTGHLIVPLPQAGATHVADEIVTPHLERRIVLPFVRVADLGREGRQFLVCT